jgi:YihY family inner membrane protein
MQAPARFHAQENGNASSKSDVARVRIALISNRNPAPAPAAEELRIGQWWGTAADALRTFLRIDGTQRAAAFAHFAFLSLFAAVILCVAAASLFFDRDRAASAVIQFIGSYLPVGADAHRRVFDLIGEIVNGRRSASVFGFAVLAWSIMRFIATLIRSVNRAWSTEPHPWWQRFLKSLLFLLVILAATPLVMTFPTLLRQAQEWVAPDREVAQWAWSVGSLVMRFTATFLALSVIYKFAPRRRTAFSEVWIPAAAAAVLLAVAQNLFGLYLKNFVSLNAVYGALGVVVAVLMWIYVSGVIFIYGACLCAARSKTA